MTEDAALDLLRGTPPLRYVTGWRQSFGSGSCPWHAHPSIEIVFHPSVGGVSHLRDGTRIEFEPGSAVIYPSALEHIQKATTPGEDWCIHAAMADGYLFGLTEPTHIQTIRDPHLVREMEDLTNPLPVVDAFDQATLGHRVTALMLRLLKGKSNPVEATPEGLAEAYCRKAIDFIHTHYNDISQITDVAEHVGVSYHHLRHCFTRERGQSLSSYLTWVRLERAKSMLIHTQCSLREIASACGFANERYFSTCFRKVSGVAPGAYRHRMQTAGILPFQTLLPEVRST